MSYFIRSGNMFRVSSEEAMDLHDTLPVGNYTIQKDSFGNLYLEMVDSFQPIKRLYGNTQRYADRILHTFNDRDISTGVMLNGEKGSGKTLLAKTLSIEAAKQGVPTILINQPWCGDQFNKFMQDIEQPCVVVFDEFEKVYDNDDQEAALTLLDGVFPSKKMFIVTCNDKWKVNEHMRNRPGRMYYMIDFTGLDTEFIAEYCNDNLKAKEHIEKICQISSLFEKFNFDMLKALVEEMNRFGETPQQALEMLNAKPEYNNKSRFQVQLFNEEIINKDKLETATWYGNPLTQEAHIEYDPNPDGDDQWITCSFRPDEIKKVDPQNGQFTYINGKGQQLVLTREKETSYNYWAF